MMGKPYLLLLASMALLQISCEKETIPQCSSGNVMAPKIILIAGQSNTHFGFGFDPQLDASAPSIFQLGRGGYDECVVKATEPLDHHSASENRIGFGLTFAKQISNYVHPNSDIILVPCGSGGTGFIDGSWNKGDHLYVDAVNRVNQLKSDYPDGELLAILWHQGETDTEQENPEFSSDLDGFISDLRSDIGADSVPFILGGMVPFWVDQNANRQAYQQLLSETPERVGITGYVDPEVPFRIAKPDDTVDEIHFDAAGQRELGLRYFQQYLELTD